MSDNSYEDNIRILDKIEENTPKVHAILGIMTGLMGSLPREVHATLVSSFVLTVLMNTADPLFHWEHMRDTLDEAFPEVIEARRRHEEKGDDEKEEGP